MQIDSFQDIQGPLLLTPKTFADNRGYFTESFRADFFRSHIDVAADFVQDNQSVSRRKGTVRGLHLQTPPHAQGKLVRCVTGSILDVAVDVRRGSTTYGRYVSAELTGVGGEQLWVPAGFLHGFATREDDCIVAYKCTDYYAQDCEQSVRWDDPDLAIDWGLKAAIVSDKDGAAPSFKDYISPFTL